MLLCGLLPNFGAVANAQILKEPVAAVQKQDEGLLIAYPNPTKDILLIKSKDKDLKIKNVAFYSILGMQMLTYNINLNAAEINLEKLRPGKYLMKYTLSDGTSKVKQIIKQ